MGGFGKGTTQTSAMPMQNTAGPDYSGQMMEMMGMFSEQMGAMMESQQAMLQGMQQPQTPSMPNLATSSQVDWTEQNQQLANKLRADYKLDQARRKGRSDTILTSPLLDEDEDVYTSSSLIGGGN